MAIRPVDLQVLVPKTAEVSKVQHASDTRHGTSQQVVAENMQKQADFNRNSVIETNKSEKDYIKNNENKKNKQKYTPEKRDKRSKDKGSDSNNNSDSTSMFDITI